jgi:hypothetical protein
LCATNRSDASRRRGRAQVRSYKGSRWPVDGGSMLPLRSLWERALCATNLRSGTPRRGCRAQGALPQARRALSQNRRGAKSRLRQPAYRTCE